MKKSRPTTEAFILQTIYKYKNIAEGDLRIICHRKFYDMFKVVRIIDWLVREKQIFRYRIRNLKHYHYNGFMLSVTDPKGHASKFIMDILECWIRIDQERLQKMYNEIEYPDGAFFDIIDELLRVQKIFADVTQNPITGKCNWIYSKNRT